MIELKTHSIVSTDRTLRENHIGEPVTHNGVNGKLIRYIPEGGVLEEMTLSQAVECLKENRAKKSD
jgi:hypothetical protein